MTDNCKERNQAREACQVNGMSKSLKEHALSPELGLRNMHYTSKALFREFHSDSFNDHSMYHNFDKP